jgi:hypothetical protein
MEIAASSRACNSPGGIGHFAYFLHLPQDFLAAFAFGLSLINKVNEFIDFIQ